MTTIRRTLIVAALVLATASVVAADFPPGKWWRRPEIVQQLGLSDEQQVRLDGIFRNAANELIDLKGEVEKQNIALRGELDQPKLDRQEIQKVAAHLNDSRSRLFQRELMMLVDMRSVLTDTQWTTMRNQLERFGNRDMRSDQDGPKGGMRNPRMLPRKRQ
jgi:Spy/CpxP family protein refolding chaperone